jgi:hypothetical protein
VAGAMDAPTPDRVLDALKSVQTIGALKC